MFRALEFLRRYWPPSLRVQLMLILLPVVGLPVIATGYVLQMRGHQVIAEEKQVHLQGVTALLARYLKDQGGYSGLLAASGLRPDDREGQIRFLNRRLRAYTDEVAEAFPEIGVGYFHLGLNAIVTYGPSAEYDKTVGTTIPPEHPGWKVLASGNPMTVSGGQVRGSIMNAMLPIKEDGRVVGYIWANEFLDAIEQQASTMRLAVYSMTLLGFVLSLAVVVFIISQLTGRVDQIKRGLKRLQFDLHQPIPAIKGEIGEIVDAINDLAQALLQTRSMHHNILDSLSDAVVTVDAENRVSYINPAGCALFQCQADTVIGKPYLALFRDDANFSSLVVDTLKSGREHRAVELDYPLPHQTPHVLASTSRLFDGRGHQLGVVAIIRDISETYSLRQQVARADRLAAVGEVAAGIAHELRTPLTSIRGFVQFLQGSTDPKEWQEYGDIIIREVDGLNRIVSELLDLVRPRPLHTEPSDINQLLEETLLLARDSTHNHRINFIVEAAGDLPAIAVDRGQIKQVLLNIIVNAIQSISDQGEIRIVTAHDGATGVRLSVSDTGCGIPATIVERIFDPFFSTKPTGTGLGMPVARRIMESHHGSIEIESTEGQGSRVTLILPGREGTR
ncbi:MAG: two-component system sensor histidine kinase AtoS [Betaproteobacteria bacterium]